MAGDFIKELTDSFLTGNTTDFVDPITFIEAPWGLNFKLLPVQKFILKTFYGLELDSKDAYIPVADQVNEKILWKFTEVEFLHWCYEEGRCNTKETVGKRFLELILVLGRRSGKSTLVSVISAYELYKLVKKGNPLDYYGFPPQESICLLNVAPTDGQASIIFDQTQKLAMQCPFTSSRVINPTQDYFSVQTDYDQKSSSAKKTATIHVISGGCASNALRGRNSLLVIMDEMAFFIDNAGRFSSEEVYKALTPATSTFKGEGRIIGISSPYSKHGKFFTRYQQSFDEPDTTLMFKMYSAMVNPAIDPVLLKTERRRNRVSFMGEFGAEFTDSVTAWIDDETPFRNCINKNITVTPRCGKVGIPYFMGLDIGIKNDATAVAFVHKDEQKNKIVVDYVEAWFSGSSDVWERENSIYEYCNKYAMNELIKLGDVAAEIQDLMKWFPCKSGFFDQFQGYALMELLGAMNMKQFRMEPFTDSLNNEIYQLFKTLYLDGLIELPDHPIIIPELLSLQAEKKGKNKLYVRAPNKAGSHDDISDAIAIAVYECYNYYHSAGGTKITSMIGNGSGRQVVSGQQGADSNATMFAMNRMMRHGASQRNPNARSNFRKR